MMEYRVLANPQALADRAADIVAGEIISAGSVTLGLAGGSTPRATYETLAKRKIDWSMSKVWMTDERWVAPDHVDANQRMVRESLTDAVGVEFLAPDTTIGSPADSAAAFSAVIVPTLRSADRSVVLLGIGTDGHTASLFPATPALDARGLLYVENYVEALDVFRLTTTFDLIADSDLVLFLVAGAAKASMVASIAAGAHVPASRITAKERVLWLLDDGAASKL